MNSKALSARQLFVAMLVGGLSSAAALSGRGDWRWLLAALLPAGGLAWLLLKKAQRGGLYCGVGGKVLGVLYGGWAVVLLAATLQRASERIQITSGGGSDRFWVLVLIVLPLLWMGRGEAAAFFRAAEIFWLAMVVVLVGVFVAAIPRIQWRWLWGPMGDWRQSGTVAVLTLSTVLFILPYMYKVKGQTSACWRGLGWLAVLGLLTAALSAVTAGTLSPAVAGQLEASFFVASGVLGESVRGEGLISALWLLPDLTLAGLLSRTWPGKYGPAAAVLLGTIAAAAGMTTFFSHGFLAAGTLVLVAATLLIPTGKGKIVVRFW